jgi:hypothetical protein
LNGAGAAVAPLPAALADTVAFLKKSFAAVQ